MFELSKQFLFDAAHTLECATKVEASRRIHGHSYRAEVSVRGIPDVKTGMVIDLGLLEKVLEEAREGLDHRFLDKVEGLGPATLENLCVWIWERVAPHASGLIKVTVSRDSSHDKCIYRGPSKVKA